MGIWIRSQDKKQLHLVQSFMLNDKCCLVAIVGVTSFGVQYSLGEYITEEKALEILEQIQRHITMLGHNQMYSCNPEEQYSYETYIFEMPEK